MKMKGLKRKVTLLLVTLIVCSNISIIARANNVEQISTKNTTNKVVINNTEKKVKESKLTKTAFAKTDNAEAYVANVEIPQENIETPKENTETTVATQMPTYTQATTPITAFAEEENAKVNDVATEKETVKAAPSTSGSKVKVNIKKAYKTQIPIGTVKKLKITNQSGKLKVKSSNAKIIKITKNNNLKAKKPGKTTITIKTNGKIIKRRVKSVIKLKITYTKKKKLTLNVGQSKKIRKLYTYTTNMETLKKYITDTKVKKCLKKIDNKAENPSASVKNTDLANVSGKKINAKNKGNTTVKIKCGKQSFKVSITVTKKAETTFKGEKAKVAYSLNEAYQYIKDSFNNYSIKGYKPKYPYIVIGFDKSVERIKDELYDKSENDFDSPDNFHSLRNQLSCCYEVNKYSDGTKYIDVDFYNNKELSELKKLYNTAQGILKSLNIDSFTEDYEKLIALGYWFRTQCTYAPSKLNDELFDEVMTVLYNHEGVCADFATTINYFCSIMKISCINTDLMSNSDHEWNIVKIGDKWYHYEARTCMFFFGDKDLLDLGNMNTDYKMSNTLYYGKWDKKVSDDSIILYQSKLKGIAEKCGITTEKNGKNKIWNRGFANIINDLE